MDKQIAIALVNPATLSRSRTGGVIARYLGRTDLQLVGARMFAPTKDVATRFADLIEKSNEPDSAIVSTYVRSAYAPDTKTGLSRRVLMLVFEGQDAVAKLAKATGSVNGPHGAGLTVRDTYGEYVADESGKVTYVEPAVVVAPNAKAVVATLKLWSEFGKTSETFVSNTADVLKGAKVQKTLVILKPDNFRINSGRPGQVMDVLSSSGLRIVAAKRFGMSVAQAEEFYGPVKDVLNSKFKKIAGKGVAAAIFKELGCEVPDASMDPVYNALAPYFATNQFDNIVEFMTGLRPSACTDERKRLPGTASCLALIYEGEDAVATIRTILGATNPKDAAPGTIRSEFAINVMVNAAHASDSPESVTRELGILKFEEDMLTPLYEQYRTIMDK